MPPVPILPFPALLASPAAPAFFAEVAALLVASALVAYLCHQLRITPIVSFLVTGALIGPQALGLVADESLIEAAAEVGVVLLLFTIGIEFSLVKLVKIQRLIFLGGGLQVGLSLAVVTGLLALFGVNWRTGLFTACLVALSSTVIVMKLLLARGETDSTAGQTVLGVLIFQDLAVVAMVLLVPILGGQGGSAEQIGWALLKAVGLVAVVLVAARRLMPAVLDAVARTCSQEIFVLSVMAICFGTAYLTSLAGVSLSLGAFLAGLVVSESRFSEMAFGEIQPLQILFSATFFVSVGLLLDLRYLVTNLPLVLAVVAAVLVIKVLSTAVSLRLLGAGAGTVVFSSLMIAQVGEFSFVLERTGRTMGLFPAGLEQGGPQAFIAATVILMMSTPLLARLGASLEQRVARKALARKPEAAPAAAVGSLEDGGAAHAGPADHVLIAGYGQGGRRLAQALDEEGVPFVILTPNPDGAWEAEQQGRRVVRGSYTRQHELSLAGVHRARLAVVADDDLETTQRVIRALRAINSRLPILAGTRFEHEIEGLREAGAAHVVSQEHAASRHLVDKVLDELRTERSGDTYRLTARQRGSARCTHTAEAREVKPGTAGCEECIALGDTWHHLRICMTCGHVGCCDESKNKHATAHFAATRHPVIKSFQPGEDWAWCYVDEAML